MVGFRASMEQLRGPIKAPLFFGYAIGLSVLEVTLHSLRRGAVVFPSPAGRRITIRSLE